MDSVWQDMQVLPHADIICERLCFLFFFQFTVKLLTGELISYRR